MKVQFDHRERVVSEENLRAMCDRVSGTCHRYHIQKITERYCYVEYSNPDEYGSEHPMVAVFPVYHTLHVHIILDIVKVMYDSWQGEGWQAFQILMDCPSLWRAPENGVWKSHWECLTDDERKHLVNLECHRCSHCDIKKQWMAKERMEKQDVKG